ncbi:MULTISPECIES: hypothetical protein [Streptomyces]|uniref:hypothetical protein n=1 Tax=Streptomyces TaxID=1883 RepID=UPI00068AC255|nr:MULTISPECIES: hypothetical protein [Streptomyces]
MRRWAARRDTARDRGAATLEFAALSAAVFATLVLLVSVGLRWMAQDRAHTAARKAVEVGRSYQASPSDGVAQAREWLSHSPLLREVSVSAAGSSAQRVRVTVQGEVRAPLFGWTFHVSEHADAPVEKWPAP